MTKDDAANLYRRMLLELWHADDADLDALAAEIAGEDLVLHQHGGQRRGPAVLADLVRQGRAPFDGVEVTIDVGPAVDEDLVAARWIFRGAYAGGIPGATADPGTRVTFSGIDLVRLAEGRVTEYWVCSDGVHLMAQLGAT